MIRRIFKKRGRVNMSKDIDPDEIFMDSQNLPQFDIDQMEGRIEKTVSRKTITFLSFIFIFFFLFLSYKIFTLQVLSGEEFREISENNRLRHSVIFAARGNILDRNGELLAWNEPQSENQDFPKRVYSEKDGFANLIGYIKYPQQDAKGFYYEFDYKGIDGVEQIFDDSLSGENGRTIVETNALGDMISENTIFNSKQGESINLSIDSGVQENLYSSIKSVADDVGFNGGGGIIMSIHTGEVLAMATYPELDSQKLTDGDKEYLSAVNSDPRNPFLNRITQGLYTPGSIVKPFMALAVLNEGVIDEYTNIVSTGKLEVPNPYNPSNPTFFSDWKAHGAVDVRHALAVSSNIYFYVVGGGHNDIEGLGITRLEKYMRSFGFGKAVEGDISSPLSGTIPSPEWKAENFDGDIWRLGDTYFTSIGQYGFQVTPIQVVRSIAMIANEGKILNPKLIKDSKPEVDMEVENISRETYKIVKEGMRLSVLEGTAKGLNLSEVEIAGKTGTAELGVSKDNVNSWTVGFFPYQNPQYAFAIFMEKGSRKNLIGGVAVTRRLFDWMKVHTPEYFGIE